MRLDLKKCGAHNVVHGLRETCPKCVEVQRGRALASAGPRQQRPSLDELREAVRGLGPSIWIDAGGWVQPSYAWPSEPWYDPIPYLKITP